MAAAPPDRNALKETVKAAFQDLHRSIGFATKEEQFATLQKAQALLRAYYFAAVAEVTYTDEERNSIYQQLPRALLGIGSFISHTTTYFPPHGSLGWSKIERSGLQFLTDQFRAANAGVTQAFEDFEAAEDIKGWDDRLKGASFYLPFNIHEFDMPEEQLRMIPPHHFWLAVPFI